MLACLPVYAKPWVQSLAKKDRDREQEKRIKIKGWQDGFQHMKMLATKLDDPNSIPRIENSLL